MRTSTRILLIALSVFLSSMIGLAYYNAYATREALEHAAVEQSTVVCRMAEDSLRTGMQANRALLQVTAQLALVQELLVPGGTSVRVSNAQQQVTALLIRLQQQFPFVSTINILDADGQIVASSRETVGTNLYERRYFNQAMNGQHAEEGPIFSQLTYEQVYVLAQPVLHDDRVVGVATLVINLEKEAHLWSESMGGLMASRLLVTDSAGRVLLDSTGGSIGINVSEQLWWKQTGTRPSGTVTDHIPMERDEESVASFVRFPDADWIILALSPERLIVEEAHAALYRELVVNLLLGMLGVGGVYMVQRRHFRLLRRAQDLVREEMGEELSARFELPNDEAEALYNMVQQVIARLKDNLTLISLFKDHLQEVVDTRTQALRVSEERMRLLLDSVSNGVIGVDGMGSIQFVNPSALKMLGCLEHKLLNTTVSRALRYVGPSHVSTQGIQTMTEGVLERDDGGSFVSETVITPLLKDGRSVGSVVVFRDVTQTHELRVKIDALYRATTGAYAIWDAQGQMIECSESCVRLFAAPSAEAFMADWPYTSAGRTPEILRAETIDFIGRAQREGFLRFEWPETTCTGEIIPVEITLVSVTLKGKIGVLGCVRDLRELKKTERELELARQSAEDAAKAKSSFLATMSHEIRTPMNGVLGMAYLALQAHPDPHQAEYLRKIRAAASSLLGVINDILDFSKIEAGKIAIEKTPFNMRELMETVQTIMTMNVAQKPVQLQFLVDDGVPPCLVGDPLRISQVLTNFGSNAVKFTSHGRIVVTVRPVQPMSEDVPGCVTLYCSVRDTGIGMTAEQLDNIFEVYTQADVSISRRYGGSGLGLAISHQLVELMGGQIHVASTLGQGSEFSFILPLGVCDELIARDEDIFQDVSGVLPQATVLLAEDNEINQEIASALLTSMGLEVRVVGNGLEAVNAVAAGGIDLVLMDIQMPVMDGYEATQRIRKSGLPGVDRLPIIAMTANAMSGDHEKSLEVGMNAHVTKPFDPEALKHMLGVWLRRAAKG